MLLEGIRILDLTRLLPFDYGSMLLADMGAEVIKVEDPNVGDYMRWIPPVNKEENYIFLLTNRNKKSITLDLRKDEGKKVFSRLAVDADVIFESFRPGRVKQLGIDYESVKAVNPDVIYCSCTGYGQTGPYSQRPGHDINYLGVSGVLGETGRHTGAPIIPGVPVADMTSGVFCALAICAALIGRKNSGQGQYIDISMTDCMVSYLTLHAAALFGKTELPVSLTGGHIAYETFETRDGKFISFGNVEEKFWLNFCEVIGREDLKEFTPLGKWKKQESAMQELKGLFRTKTRKEWLDLLEGKEICYGPVNELEEVFQDPQIQHREMYFEALHPVEGPIGQVALPIKFSVSPHTPRKPSPRLGEHTEEVLKKAGYSEKQIEDLRNSGII
jgi:crotonobetainyl-CoA:carnitine CoA-transferase CaiB-like acyl-CoA transferase